MTEPEQWAVDLLEAVHDASDMGSACGMLDCPQCKAAALTIQRAFEERERKLRDALGWAIAEIEGRTRYTPNNTYEAEEQRQNALNSARQALKDTTHD